MTKFLPFLLDNDNFLTNQKCFIISGKNIIFLTAFLNSSLFKYCFKDNFPELQGGTRELSKVFFDKVCVLEYESMNIEIEEIILNIQNLKLKNIDTKELEIKLDNYIFDAYNLDEQERKAVGYIVIK